MQLAAATGKHKALQLMCDIMQRKRELRESIEAADEHGRTPLMIAAAAGCVYHVMCMYSPPIAIPCRT